MSLISKKKVEELQRILLSGDYNSKLAALRQRPVSPPDGTVGRYEPVVMVKADSKNMKPKSFQKLKMNELADMVGFIMLVPGEKQAAGAISFIFRPAREMKTLGDRVGWVPCWFLPWMENQIVKFKILSQRDHPTLTFTDTSISSMPNPGLFFTAAINGCSVFAVGHGEYPSVYHAGVGPGDAMPLEDNETSEECWQRLLGRARSTKNITSVDKSDYISERTTTRALNPNLTNEDRVTTQVPDDIKNFLAKKLDPNAAPIFKDVVTTRRADELQGLLTQNGKITKTSVTPWGAVFGLRNQAGVWHMNLVKNASVTYQKITYERSGFLGLGKVQVNKGEKTPGSLQWDLNTKLPDYKATFNKSNMRTAPEIGQVANLGYQEFFPGTEPAYFRALNNVMVF